jgi:lysophospholipase L1-like esterase
MTGTGADGPATERTGTAGTYDPVRQWYRPSAAGTRRWRWRRAAAVAGTGAARYAKIGDSISAGQGLAPATQSPPVVMGRMLAAHGLPPRGASVILNPRTRFPDARLAFTGPWAEFGSPALTTLASAGAAGASVSFSTVVEQAGEHQVRVIFLDGSAPFQVAVDDGPAATITPAGSAALATATLPLPGLTAGPHTVRITAGGELHLGSVGIEATTGIALCDFGISMATTADWVADGAPFSALRHVQAWAPDLAIIALMTNDAHNLAVPPPRYAANLEAMVTALAGTCDVVLEAQIPGDPAFVDLAPYREALYRVADATGVPVLDLFDRWGSYAAADAAGLMDDGFHPNAAGAADIAAAEFTLVTA